MACCFTRSAASSSKTCLAIAIPPWKKQGGTGRCPSGYPTMLGLFHGKSQKWMMTGPLRLRKPPCKETCRFKQKKAGFCKHLRQKCGFEHQTLEIKQQNRKLNQQAKCIWSYPTKSHNVTKRQMSLTYLSNRQQMQMKELKFEWNQVKRLFEPNTLSFSLSLYLCVSLPTYTYS